MGNGETKKIEASSAQHRPGSVALVPYTLERRNARIVVVRRILTFNSSVAGLTQRQRRPSIAEWMVELRWYDRVTYFRRLYGDWFVGFSEMSSAEAFD